MNRHALCEALDDDMVVLICVISFLRAVSCSIHVVAQYTHAYFEYMCDAGMSVAWHLLSCVTKWSFEKLSIVIWVSFILLSPNQFSRQAAGEL